MIHNIIQAETAGFDNPAGAGEWFDRKEIYDIIT